MKKKQDPIPEELKREPKVWRREKAARRMRRMFSPGLKGEIDIEKAIKAMRAKDQDGCCWSRS